MRSLATAPKAAGTGRQVHSRCPPVGEGWQTVARILLSDPADRPWSWGPHHEIALRDLGYQVLLFDFRGTRDPNDALLSTAREFAPAIHIVWKGEVFTPDTFRKLSAQGIYNVLWHPDETMPEWLPPLAKASDLFLSQFTGMMDTYRRAGIRNMDWLLDGITPSVFQYEQISPEERRKYACEVVLIGTIDRIPEYRKRMYALNRLIREGFDVKWWGRPVSFRRNSLSDWFSPARKAWGRGMVWNDTFAKACHCAKIVLGLPRCPEIPGGLSNAAFWTTGVGAFYLALYKAGIEEFFAPDREVALFRDGDEMVEKTRYYLSHDAERHAIAQAGQRRALGQYTNQQLLRRLLDMVAARGGPAV